MSPRAGRPKSANPKNDRLYIRVSGSEKKEISDFTKEHDISLLELIRLGMKKVLEKK